MAHGCELFGLLQHDQTGRLVTARLVAPQRERTIIDLLFASCGIEPEIADSAQALEAFPGIMVPVATTGHLLAMKLLSRQDERPQDSIDLMALHRLAEPADFAEARQACDLILRRGYNRGRPLLQLLEELGK